MDRDQQISETFLAACELPAEERDAYLDKACVNDSDLRAEVESLLEHDDPSSLIDSPFDIASGYSSGDSQPKTGAEPRPSLPDAVGRYRIKKILGRGGYGVVCLADDEQLDRRVAIKLPHRRLVSKAFDADAYLTEARTVAGLDYPHIVPVYDVGSTDEFPCYVVSKFIEGTDLSQRIKREPLSIQKSVEVVATIADALHYAHQQGLVHRDIKPANILIDGEGQPHVVDFGLALKEENIGKGPRYTGTPAYMSPEQARGEGHRVDGRSDIFSLGAVLYELITGHQPFTGDTRSELAQQIIKREAKPLRQYDDQIPKELERICLKSLAKRSVERYSTARDMAEDLRMFLANRTEIQSDTGLADDFVNHPGSVSATRSSTPVGQLESEKQSSGLSAAHPSSGSSPVKFVPKGLRSFDEHDADFFLELLPGPRDRSGLPESLRFWKQKIEETDVEKTFSVGLIYGPSGCGKSSLVKAGLLPRLSNSTTAIYVEAAAGQTESRLLQGLRNNLSGIDNNLGLKETLAAIRQGEGHANDRKVLIVIDQFEQWLNEHNDFEHSELVEALRQCDGASIQCLLMVRDDFWMAVTRFMRALEIRLVEGENSAAVDLFLPRHAERVLRAYGRAFGDLPNSTADMNKEQKQFIKQAVAGLAEEGKVVCVRLALFADMFKGKSWSPAALKEQGGAEGVGVAFLEETFSAATAPPQHRYHQKSARAVLQALLPDSGADIKGNMKSYDELVEASGYRQRAAELDELIHLLDNQLRLITPTEMDSVEGDGWHATGREDTQHPPPTTRHYQLTHDYLVPALRRWLNQKRKETRRGRAELRLAELTPFWNAKPENRHLPSWFGHANIRLFTRKKNWTGPQRKMMRKARQVHGMQLVAAAAMLIAVVYVGFRVRGSLVETQNITRAEGLVNSLLNAEITQVSGVVSDMNGIRLWADPLLQREISRAADGSADKLRLALGLLPADETQIAYLVRQLPVCRLDQFGVIRDALLPHKDEITAELWQLALDKQNEPNARFQALAALVEYSGDDQRWGGVDTFAAEHLTTSIPTADFGQWLAVFRPARRHLKNELIEIHADRSRSTRQLEGAAVLLADYLRDEPSKLIDVLLVADNIDEYSPLINAVSPHAANVKQPLIDVVSSARLASSASKEQRNTQLNQQAIAAATLVHLGFGESVWPFLRFTPDPTRRSALIQYLGKLNADHNSRAARLKTELDDSIRQAIIESFGVEDSASVPPVIRKAVVEQLEAFFQNDPDPGVHASAAWALRQWGLALPELPSGGPTITEQQLARISELNSAIHAEEGSRLLAQPADLPASLADGLVVHYPFDETEGTESASAIEGKPTAVYEGRGQPTWIPGVVGGAVWLEGSPSKDVPGGYFNCGNAFDPERTDTFSVGCWFFLYPKFQNRTLLSKGESFNIRFGGDTFRTILMNSYAEHNYIERIAGSIDRLSGRWNHIFVVYDGSSKAVGVKIYIDGQPASSFANVDELTKTIRNAKPFAIGGFSDNPKFKGGIDDVRIYDRVLSGEEVRALYVSGRRALARVDVDERTPEQQAVLIPAKRRAADKPPITDSQPRGATTSSSRAEWTNEWKRIRRWYVNGQGQTMLVVPNPSFLDHPRIDHSYAIASYEVTIDQFCRFRPDHRTNPMIAPSGDCPVHAVSWLSAVEYCNWLSEQEGIPKEQWVYEPDKDGNFSNDTIVRGNFLDLQGYRLPTGEESEHARRAGTNSTYAFGEPESLVGSYGWTNLNSAARSHPVGSLLPNRWGLFDMLGNVQEWHQESLAGPGTSFKLGGGSFSQFPWDKNLNDYGLSNASRARASSTLYLGVRPVRSLPELDEH